ALEFFSLDRKRLLHLHDELGTIVDRIGIGHDLGTRRLIIASASPTPIPASFSTITGCPALVSSRTMDGTRPTRYSLSLISFGTPTSMLPIPNVSRGRAPGNRRPTWKFYVSRGSEATTAQRAGAAAGAP